jgi:hypothetical protein
VFSIDQSSPRRLPRRPKRRFLAASQRDPRRLEPLSRILGGHAGGRLDRGGVEDQADQVYPEVDQPDADIHCDQHEVERISSRDATTRTYQRFGAARRRAAVRSIDQD